MRQFRILEGDALAVLGTLASESVHCCITSPPYWGGVVALGLDRGFVGIELNATYAAMARGRIAGDQPLFNAEAEQELAWTT